LKDLPSDEDKDKWQRPGDIAVIVHGCGVQLDSEWDPCGENDLVFAAWSRQPTPEPPSPRELWADIADDSPIDVAADQDESCSPDWGGEDHEPCNARLDVGAAEHNDQKQVALIERYELLEWIARAVQQRSPVRQDRLRDVQGLTVTPAEKDFLDDFIQRFFWESSAGFCRKLQPMHGKTAMSLRASVKLIDVLKVVMDIRKSCLQSLHPDIPTEELLVEELGEEETAACYEAPPKHSTSKREACDRTLTLPREHSQK
jgi:hypothetical protein